MDGCGAYIEILETENIKIQNVYADDDDGHDELGSPTHCALYDTFITPSIASSRSYIRIPRSQSGHARCQCWLAGTLGQSRCQ